MYVCTIYVRSARGDPDFFSDSGSSSIICFLCRRRNFVPPIRMGKSIRDGRRI